MIYILEDDASIRELVVYTLGTLGMPTQGFGLPSAFWKALQEQLPELVVLDIMLPEESGLDVLRELRRRKETEDLPVIMLTAKATEYDKVMGLENGADDYIPKPFGMMELSARIKALLRRASRNGLSEYEIGPLYVCPAKHIVRVGGKDVVLTRKEYELLCQLLENGDIVLTREQILTRIWGYSFDGESRTVDVHVRKLRQKLGEAGDLIETVRGIGYKIRGQNDA